MFPLPQLPARPGLTWRAWSAEDAPAMAAHTLAVHQAETLEHVPGSDFFVWMTKQEGFDPMKDSMAAVRDDGTIVADGGCWTHLEKEGARSFVWIEVQPGHHDLEPSLLAWVEARARQRLSDADPEKDRTIRGSVGEHRDRVISVFEDAGFERARSFVIMRRSLADLPEPPSLPDGYTVVPWSPERDDEFRTANNESFADHWGSLPMSPPAWKGMYAESDTFRADCSFGILHESGEIVAFCMSELDEEDAVTRGVRELYLQRIGTRRAHRRLRLASRTIVEAMASAATKEMVSVALEVDETSHTNATAVYLRLGFRVAERSFHYLKRL